MSNPVLGKFNLDPPRKRRRPPLSCEQCRRRKVKCDRNVPCTPCIESKNTPCTYSADTSRSGRRDQDQRPSQSSSSTALPFHDTIQASNDPNSFNPRFPSSGSSLWTTATLNGTQDSRSQSNNDPSKAPSVDELTDRIVTLQRMLSSTLDNGAVAQENSAFPLNQRRREALAKHKDGILVKTRFQSPSHWMSIYNEFDIISRYGHSLEDPSTFELNALIKKCKNIGRATKAERPAPYPHLPDFRDFVPSRELSDTLVHNYLRTFESVYRILHIPSFQKEYSQYLQNPQSATDDFVIQLLLIMAIGTTFSKSDAINILEKRASAIEWVHTAQAWLADSSEKRRLNVGGIQVRCLLILARQTCAIEGEMLWGSAGHLLRLAMQIGLHRDPKYFARLSPLQAEVRRRLWATIIEMNVQSSLDSGMPALISMKDFDTEAPSNIDDCDIRESCTTDPNSKPSSIYTQSSLQIILRKSLPLRLEILRIINDFCKEPSYDEVLRITRELTNLCRSYTLFLEMSITATPSGSPLSVTTFQFNFLDLLIRRSYLPLHRPWCLKARSDPRYYFSRKILIDTCLAMISYQSDPDFLQAVTLGRGVFREALAHPALLMCYELISQLEEANASPLIIQHNSITREPLLQALRSQIELLASRTRAGDLNVKGHLFTSMALGQIEAMETGRAVDQGIYDAAKGSLELTYELLRARSILRPLSTELAEQRSGGIEHQPADGAFLGVWDMGGLNGYNFGSDGNVDAEIPDSWLLS